MNAWLMMLLSLSFSGAAMAALLLAAARLFGRKLGQKWQYYIWLLVVFRLLLPVAAPVNLAASLVEGYKTLEIRYQDAGAASLPEGGGEYTGSQGFAGSGQPAMPGHTQADTSGMPAITDDTIGEAGLQRQLKLSAAGLLMAVSFLISAGLLGKKMWRYRRAVCLMRAQRVSPEVFEETFDRACLTCGIRRRPELIVSPISVSPVAFGVLHPSVLMPENFPLDKAYYAFCHELTHIRRRDSLYKWAVELTVSMHWFNPMVYVLRKETERACELSCDETVVQSWNEKEKRAYGDMLLATLKDGMVHAGTVMALPLGESAKRVKERLGMLMKIHGKSRYSVIAGAFLTTVLAGAALLCGFAPIQQKNPDHQRALAEAMFQKMGDKQVKAGDDKKDENTWSFDEDVRRRPEQKSFQSQLFWKKGYMFQLAWNVDSSQYGTVVQISGKPVSLTKKTERYADNELIAEALELAIEEVSGTSTFLRLEEPVLLTVDGPYSKTADELSEKFYEEDNISYLSAVIDEAGVNTRETLAERTYSDGRIDCYAIILDSKDGISQSKSAMLAERAAREGKTDFFAITADGLPEQTMADSAKLAYGSGRVDIFAIAADRMPKEELKALARQAAMENKIDFFSIASDSLTKEELADVALDAYNAANIDVFYMTYEHLSSQQAGEVANKAYDDNRIEFLYAICDKLTAQQKSALRKRAMNDNKIEFWYALSE